MTAKMTTPILILDDDCFMLSLLEELLSGLGYANIACYTNGHEALYAMQADDTMPHIILLDINMPCMDGIEFVRHLTARNYQGSLILVSGEAEIMLRATEKLALAHKQRVQGHLQKPPLVNELADLMAKCLRSRPPAASVKQPKTYSAEELQHAIAHGQLLNYYQPKVSVMTGECMGVETLVRWQHPTDGLLFPDQFIPLAEAHQLIDSLTYAVMHMAFKQTKQWHDAGLKLRVAINISMDNLHDLRFADYVIAETTALGTPHDAVVLEVTESRLMQNVNIALDILTRLRLNRFALSIDDFGTGHSSLAQLRDYPFTELKIDRNFTHNAHSDARLKAIFEGSLELANLLHMQVVAEGVEDMADWQFLREKHCPIAQGYFISRPMRAEQLPEWLDAWQQRVQTEQIC